MRNAPSVITLSVFHLRREPLTRSSIFPKFTRRDSASTRTSYMVSFALSLFGRPVDGDVCDVYLSWHSSFWCLSKLERGNCFRQKVHSVGSSLTAFSTARFLQHRFLLISHLHRHGNQRIITQCSGFFNIYGMYNVFTQVCEQCRAKSSCLLHRKEVIFFLLQVVASHFKYEQNHENDVD